MRHQGKDASIGALHKECQGGHQTHHLALACEIDQTNDDHEDSCHNTENVNQDLLAPKRACKPIESVTQHTPCGSEYCVQNAKDGSESSRICLAKIELLVIESTKNGVDTELYAETAEMRHDESQDGESRHCFRRVVHRRFRHLFPAGGGQ